MTGDGRRIVRFPRTRGDRPLAETIMDTAAEVPPHTRG